VQWYGYPSSIFDNFVSSMKKIVRAYSIHLIGVSRWKPEFLEKSPKMFGEGKIVARYEKRIRELEHLLERKEVETRGSGLDAGTC